MENATKFLLMAASVLIAVAVLGLGGYLFSIFGSYATEINNTKGQQLIEDFNGPLLAFSGREDITIHEIVSVANYAKENNQYYEVTSPSSGNYYLQIVLQGVSNSFENQTQDKYNELISNVEYHKDANDKIMATVLYKCSIDISEITGRVCKMTFTSI